ncbi:MAG TPA: DUF1223 domain-containing protein [Methylophilaceae bacterium]|jgi:hypothetical protein
MSHSFLRWSCFLAALFSTSVIAAECSVQSSTQRVALLELYTSEGCSSCPPTDKWVSSLEKRGYSSDKVIPIALHVDYWDYIGWKDRFADAAFTARQHAQAALDHSSFVYTPQVVLDGKDYRSYGSGSRFADDVNEINHSAARANIALTVSHDAAQYSLKVNAHGPAKSVLYLALVENGLSSDVKAGENSGTKLYHDHVVRAWLGPFNVETSGLELQRSVAIKPEWKTANLRAVAFVQEANGEVAQAVATPACSG